MNIILEIAEYINKNEAVVFCGSGISKESGIPIVNQLVPHILSKFNLTNEEYNLMLNEDKSLQIPFEAFIETLEASCKIESLLNIFSKGRPNTNHLLLAHLVKAGKLKTIITTNFDTLIEDALAIVYPTLKKQDYDVFFKENSFKKINWSDNRIKIIKLHGSIDHPKEMAITLKRVASKALSEPRMSVIKKVFADGNHKAVVILGYSSSDTFDLSPQIQSIIKKHKNVFYIQHSEIIKMEVEELQKQEEKNPFKKFKTSNRVYCNTKEFVEHIWGLTVQSNDRYQYVSSTTEWKVDVDNWYNNSLAEKSATIKYTIPASIYASIDEHAIAIRFNIDALKIAKTNKDKAQITQLKFNLANGYNALGDVSTSIKYYKLSLLIALKDKDLVKLRGPILGNLGSVFMSIGQFDTGLKYSTDALNIAIKEKDREAEGTWTGALGSNYMHRGNYKKGRKYFEHALKIALEEGEKKDELTWIGAIGSSYMEINEYQKGYNEYKKAYEIAIEIGDRYSQGLWLNAMGSAASSLNRHAEALENHNQAVIIFKAIDNKREIGKSLYDLSISENSFIGIEKRLEYLESALHISKEVKDRKLESSCYSTLGSHIINLDKKNEAINYHTEAIRIAVKIKDKKAEGAFLLRLAASYKTWGELTKAKGLCYEAMRLAKKFNNRIEELLCLNDLAIIYDSEKKIFKAFYYYVKGLRISRNIGNKQAEERFLTGLGIMYKNLNRISKAIKCYKKVSIILEEIDNPYALIRLKVNLGNLYRQEKEFEKAIEYHQEAIELSKSKENLEGLGYAYENLGNTYYVLERWDDAINNFSKSLKAYTEFYGAEHFICREVQEKLSHVQNLKHLEIEAISTI